MARLVVGLVNDGDFVLLRVLKQGRNGGYRMKLLAKAGVAQRIHARFSVLFLHYLGSLAGVPGEGKVVANHVRFEILTCRIE